MIQAKTYSHIHNEHQFQDFIGKSEPMQLAYKSIRQVADTNMNVLVRGESGTGKELAARALVHLSRRADKPYIRLNCAALPETLIESELFGSERGAFTGANESRPGQIELADGGTLFLDEIATLPMSLQTKLLRVLEERQVQRLGGRTPRKIDFRLICATNQPLEQMVSAGEFREDLFFRIHVVPIQLPSLRHRVGDVPLLCEHFLQIHCAGNRLAKKRFAAEALQSLEDWRWPGNVRELENLVQRLIVTVTEEEIGPGHLPFVKPDTETRSEDHAVIPAGGIDFDRVIEAKEIALLTEALRQARGSKTAAGRLLSLNTQRVKYLCRKHAL